MKNLIINGRKYGNFKINFCEISYKDYGSYTDPIQSNYCIQNYAHISVFFMFILMEHQ